jgi:DNA-binding MurR/RpiR family transcriptional regulator
MKPPLTFDEQINTSLETMTPAEQRVARFFQENREEVLIASASALAGKAGTSDATVIRTAKALGFSGMEALRRTLAAELRQNLSPAGRLAQTLREIGDGPAAALDATLDIHQKAIEGLRRDITPAHFETAVQCIVDAGRVFIFGIGPSSAMADYFTIQLRRFGIEALSLTQTGLLLADGLQRLRERDLLLIFAYSRVYRELAVLLNQSDRRGVARILFTDTLGPKLRRRVDVILPVARGRADMLSMHTATLGLIEALLVGIATKRPQETLSNLRSLNELRAELVGGPMDLPVSKRDA